MVKHAACVHNVGVSWHVCDAAGCAFKSKQTYGLRMHTAAIHGIGVVWHACDVDACTYKCKQATSLRAHKASMHDVDVVWRFCDVPGCAHKCKSKSSLAAHKTYMHDAACPRLACDIAGCDFSTKYASSIKLHQADKHNIGVVLLHCGVDGCTYSCKQSSSMTVHRAGKHDIGKYKCDFCLSNRSSHIEYDDAAGAHHICRACYNTRTGKASRAETAMSEHLDTLPWLHPHLVGSDRAFKSLGGCQLYRPDKLYIIDGPIVAAADGAPTFPQRIAVQVECDEHEHAWANGNYSCDEKRISDCYDEIDCAHYIVVRWNPHSFTTAGGGRTPKMLRAARLDALAALIKQVLAAPPAAPLHIYYLYYSATNERIAKNIPFTLCY